MSVAFNPDEQRILSTFSGRIQPVPISPGYGLALGLVAILMVLLPLIYLAIVGVVAWSWCWYAAHGMELFGGGRHGVGNLKVMLIMYGGPLVIGAVLVLFMFKPLFARAPKGAKPLSVDERREPFLFAFVQRVCEAVGAPMPRRIDITCEVNASASFRRGMISMLGRDLVLTIGLPLVAGQNLRQFTGVLAHEFGHFAQGWAMRANYLIRTVNHWFARVVYQRDAMDEWLVAMANSDSHFAINLVLHLARLFVWLTRRVLWVLMQIGHLISSLLSRQMEFDADRHAFRLVGREPFASALRELPVLSAAESGAHQDLGNAWRERRLADDLPLLISANLGQIEKTVRTRIINEGLCHSGGMYASHPPSRDRIAATDRDTSAAVFGGTDAPAKVLFRDFPQMCREATFSWYRDQAGLTVDRANLVPTGTIVADYEREVAVTKAAERILGTLWTGPTLFAPVEPAEAPTDEAALHKEAEAAEEAVIDAFRLQALALAGVARKADAGNAVRDARVRRTQVRTRVARAAAALSVRLAPAGGSEAERLRAGLAALALQQERLDQVREGFLALVALLEHVSGREQDETFVGLVQRRIREQHTHLSAMREACIRHPYPLEHQQRDISLAGYLVPEAAIGDDLGPVMEASEQAMRNAYALHRRLLSRLATLTEAPVEAAATSSAVGSEAPVASSGDIEFI